MANEPVITIIGNLTRDPELRYVSSGKPVCNFTVAVTPRSFNKQTSNWEDGEATFYQCAVWDAYAENAADTLRKGMSVIVTGRLYTRQWQKNDGTTGLNIEIQAAEVGPTLRWQKAQVTKATSNATPQQGYGQQGYGQQGYGQQGPWQDDQPPF